jgi:glycosyltransferase involved in cell wall biosynthesis
MSISVVILTLNEEVNLPGALLSISRLCDDVVVFDSFSNDRTCDLADGAGARVYQRSFDNYAAQRNAALTEITYRHPWVFMLDADERITPELWNEMLSAVRNARGEVLFRCRRKDFFLGRWIKRSSGYPTWFGRLMLVGKVRVERRINEEYIALGAVGYLKHHLHHYPFNRGVDHWVERHNQYSSAEARYRAAAGRECWHLEELLFRDPVVRRKALKRIAMKLPFRPFFAFLYLYLFRLGFLDGVAGLKFCKLRYFYEFLIDIKAQELQSRGDME